MPQCSTMEQAHLALLDMLQIQHVCGSSTSSFTQQKLHVFSTLGNTVRPIESAKENYIKYTVGDSLYGFSNKLVINWLVLKPIQRICNLY